jgi:NADH:ubiquinone oxidoreductase subunit E
MTSLYVCMGSTCHLKSAQSVVEVFRRKIQEYQLQDGVGLCSEAVPVKVGETVIHGVTVENASEMFEREVLPLIGGQ